MTDLYDCADPTALLTGMRLARQAIGRGELVVIPTDTVYGVAADAFSPAAVQRLLDAKGRGRTSPPPVLIPGEDALSALAERVPDAVRTLVAEFWPGGLTVILPQRQTLSWDLGETRGTVALRVPSNPVALELLRETGPLAVSSANTTGVPAARTAVDARSMLGDRVAVYLDDGSAGGAYGDGADRPDSSTIVDAVRLAADAGPLRIVRQGVVDRAAIAAVVGADLLEDAAT